MGRVGSGGPATGREAGRGVRGNSNVCSLVMINLGFLAIWGCVPGRSLIHFSLSPCRWRPLLP